MLMLITRRSGIERRTYSSIVFGEAREGWLNFGSHCYRPISAGKGIWASRKFLGGMGGNVVVFITGNCM